MDLAWLKRDWSLAATSVGECALVFSLVFAALSALDFAPLQAGLAAAIAMATSPAVVLLVAQDARAEGQVTERALTLVALNSLLASVVVTMLLATVHYEVRLDITRAVLHPLYLFAGSLALGGAMASLGRALAGRIERSPELHFTLVEGRGRELMAVDLGRASRLFYVVLFVITGASLPLAAFETAGVAAAALVAARAAGKVAGVLAFAPLGGVRLRQALALGAALLPMSSIALLLQHDVARLYPEFGQQLAALLLASIFVMELAGPLAAQWGFRFAGEAAPEPGAAQPAKGAVAGAAGQSR
jgi:Kef-type K+ transport system membrane component KefB